MYLVDVVVVDTGFTNLTKSNIGYKIEGFGIVRRGKSYSIVSDYFDEKNHGTGVVGIIFQHAPNASCLVIKLVNPDVIIEDILFALQYIIDNVSCKFVNLSFGISLVDDYRKIDQLDELCKKIDEKGTVIVSAYSNNGGITYPAAFESVIGVTTGEECHRIDDIRYVSHNVVNFCAKGNNQPVLSAEGNGRIVRSGDSYACAHVTGIFLTKYQPLKKRQDYLNDFGDEKGCKEKVIEQEYLMMEEWKNKLTGKKCALLFWGKEMHSIVRFSEEAIVDLIAVYDIRQQGNIGRDVFELIRNEKRGIVIEDYLKMDFSKFEVLVIGHIISEYLSVNVLNSLKKICAQCIENDIMIYSFEEIDKYIDVDKNTYFCPTRIRILSPYENYGKLFPVSTPIVGVFGTSSSQGKFFIQLSMRHLLRKKGYDVGFLGTEPTSLLFGADDLFSFGFHSNLGEDGYSTIVTLNEMLHRIDMKNKDIIIVGCQSVILQNVYENIKNYTIKQINFLLGTLPDVFVLCVNYYDTTEYVKRTIMFLESMTNNNVKSIIISPVNRSSKDCPLSQGKKGKYIYQVTKICNIPVIDSLKDDWCKNLLLQIGVV